MRTSIVAVLAFFVLQIFSIPVDETWNSKTLSERFTHAEKLADRPLQSKRLGWCGFQKNKSTSRRQKRFVLQGSRWKINPVTYNITKYPPDAVLSRDIVDREISAAFRAWDQVSNLSFKRAWEGKVNIDIRFEIKYHGDDEEFDGKGGMTAHAFYPNFGGAIHFDSEEPWTSRSSSGINLFQVATHEIGHALGLEHSEVAEAVMSPYYINYNVNFKLGRDDIEGIQALYGKKSFSVCENSRINAAVTMIDGATYLFKGSLVYKLQNLETTADPDYPKEISKVFEGLNGPLDAAFTRSNGVSYFFKDDNFWRFTNMSLDLGFPKKIADFFPFIPTPLDAAVVFPRDENIYFIKGGLYWKFDHTQKPPVSSDYPKSISEWKGIPTSIDAAIRLVDKGQPAVYFFKGNYHWKFNDRSSSIYLSDPPFPRFTGMLFPECNRLLSQRI